MTEGSPVLVVEILPLCCSGQQRIGFTSPSGLSRWVFDSRPRPIVDPGRTNKGRYTRLRVYPVVLSPTRILGRSEGQDDTGTGVGGSRINPR